MDGGIIGGAGICLFLTGLYLTGYLKIGEQPTTNLTALLVIGKDTFIYTIYSGLVGAGYYAVKKYFKRRKNI